MPCRRMPCRSSKLDVLSFTSPAACRPNCWQSKKHEKQSPSETKVPSYWKMFFGQGFCCFLLLWDERPSGNYAVKANQRLSLAWAFGLSWWHEGSERAHPARVFFFCFCQKKQWREAARTFCAIKYRVPFNYYFLQSVIMFLLIVCKIMNCVKIINKNVDN